MTPRKLQRSASHRLRLEWNLASHVMAAAFWSQGHQINPEELNPLRQAVESGSSAGVEMESNSEEAVPASRVRVGE